MAGLEREEIEARWDEALGERSRVGEVTFDAGLSGDDSEGESKAGVAAVEASEVAARLRLPMKPRMVWRGARLEDA